MSDETEWVDEEKHHHWEEDDSADVRQSRDAARDAGGETADHCSRDAE